MASEQLAFVGMPSRIPPPSTVCPWCHEDPCLYDCEESVSRYEDGFDDREEDWEAYLVYVRERERIHQELGMPMWGHLPIGRKIETSEVKPRYL